jgi:parvulin-like peptidyl-prolyl isomerase
MRALAVLLLGSFVLVACDDKPKTLPASASQTAKLPEPPPPVAESGFQPKAATSEGAVPNEVVCQQVLVGYKGAQRAQKRAMTRSKEEAKKVAEGLLVRAQADEDFTELVKKYSDDPAAVETLGNTGKFTREKMSKPFSDAAFKLKVGEISPVVESPFGFHIIKRNQ